jgi:hypothetical protein
LDRLVDGDRNRADPPAGGLEDGIGDRSRRAGDPDFAGAFGARWPEVGVG